MVVAFLPKLYEAFRSVLPFLAISFVSGRGEDRTELFIALIGILGGFGAIATYITTRYGIEDGHLVCTSGWLFKRDRRIPLNQIHNVNIKQGLLERFLKVVTVEVETAASAGAELKLQVITEEAAENLRSALSQTVAPAMVEKADEPSNVVYQVNRQDLLLGAMTENQGGQILFAIIGTAGAAVLAQVVHHFAQIKALVPVWFLWIGTAVVIAIILALGWIYGGVQYAIRFGGFTVRSEPGLLRISHGLFTKLQYAVRLPRVEIASVSSTVWQRIVKRGTVRVGTAGTFGEQGTTVPIALMLPNEATGATLRQVLPTLDLASFRWIPFPRYYLTVSLIRTTMSLALMAGLGWIATHSFITRVMPDVTWVAPTILAILFGFIYLDHLVAYRKAAYAVSDTFLAVRRGFFLQTTTYIPIQSIDTVGTKEPRWWRKRGYTQLNANAMAHSVMIDMLPIETAEDIRQRVTRRSECKPEGYSLNLLQAETSLNDDLPKNP